LSNKPVLSVKDLSVSFQTDTGFVEITDRVGFDIYPGEVFGLVGESGCGKTVTTLAIQRLLPRPGTRITSGEILLGGKSILLMSLPELRKIRGREVGMIFQEPAAAMDPLMKVGAQMYEVFEYHKYSGDRHARVAELLTRVGFPDPDRTLSAFPHELSGGMLQRVMIAAALLLKPSLVIADEPTTALDVTVQAGIMELLEEMQRETGTAILFITHNLSLVAQYAARVAVMYAGRIVEEARVEDFLKNPLHPYSKGLLAAIPDIGLGKRTLTPIPGQVPQPSEFLTGCRFRDRCSHAFEKCGSRPELVEIEDGHRVACFLYEEDHGTS